MAKDQPEQYTVYTLSLSLTNPDKNEKKKRDEYLSLQSVYNSNPKTERKIEIWILKNHTKKVLNFTSRRFLLNFTS